MQVATDELPPHETRTLKPHAIDESEPLAVRLQKGKDVQEIFSRLKERVSASKFGAPCLTQMPAIQTQKPPHSPEYAAYLETFIQ